MAYPRYAISAFGRSLPPPPGPVKSLPRRADGLWRNGDFRRQADRQRQRRRGDAHRRAGMIFFA